MTHKTEWVRLVPFLPTLFHSREAPGCSAEDPRTPATPPRLCGPRRSYLAILSFLIVLIACSKKQGRSGSRGLREERRRQHGQVAGAESFLSHLPSQPLTGTLLGLQKQPISGTFATWVEVNTQHHSCPEEPGGAGGRGESMIKHFDLVQEG